MNEHRNITNIALQETRINQNKSDSRKRYTSFFSGEGGRKEYPLDKEIDRIGLDQEPITFPFPGKDETS